jgi:hypothetical protein
LWLLRQGMNREVVVQKGLQSAQRSHPVLFSYKPPVLTLGGVPAARLLAAASPGGGGASGVLPCLLQWVVHHNVHVLQAVCSGVRVSS